jgi:ABC-type multidrug transport system fused ATPase/permease subunit
LSGGEKQKIGIARAILKKSLLYIFDEPASFLDLKTEKGILDYFSSQQKKVTQIIITHRIHTIMNADWVLVMEDGKIISQGAPKYLVNHSQVFKRLYELDKSSLK